jgi:hypothetical protein
MVEVFRDNVRGVLAGVCCAAVAMCKVCCAAVMLYGGAARIIDAKDVDRTTSMTVNKHHLEAERLKLEVLAVRKDEATKKFFSSFEAPDIHIDGIPDDIFSICRMLDIPQRDYANFSSENESEEEDTGNFALLLAYFSSVGVKEAKNYLEKVMPKVRLYIMTPSYLERIRDSEFPEIPPEFGNDEYRPGISLDTFNAFKESEHCFYVTLRFLAFSAIHANELHAGWARSDLSKFLRECEDRRDFNSEYCEQSMCDGLRRKDFNRVGEFFSQRADIVKYCELMSAVK